MIDLAIARLIVLALLCLLIGAVAVILRLYVHAWRTLPREARITPLHVALVSAGMLLLATGLAWALVAGLRMGPVTPYTLARLIMYGTGSLLILASLWVIARVQRRRVHFARSAALDVHADPPDS